MMTFSESDMTRRSFLSTGVAFAALLALPLPAHALDTGAARALVDAVVADINRTISSGRSEQAMYGDFRQIFVRYADVPTIARSTLGPAARQASQQQLAAFTDAFSIYMARKYGARFREFIGGEIVVRDAKPVNNFVEVQGQAVLRGQAPFAVAFRVSDRSGQVKFFDLLIEGISLLTTERTEIGAMLDQRRGNIDQLTRDLRGGA
jgi:phospholipid transport system substrate-binding protein